jgi:UDP-N-acetylmuramyl tripeptide synthase
MQRKRTTESSTVAVRPPQGIEHTKLDPKARIKMPGLTGITGSNGKTTTADLVDSVLRAAGHTEFTSELLASLSPESTKTLAAELKKSDSAGSAPLTRPKRRARKP